MDEEFSQIWKALADPSRRVILDLLRERPRTTGEISNEISSLFQVSRFAVMKHLAVLEQAGLIVVRREGRERWNHLNAIPLQSIYERWLKPYESQWATAMLRMKQFVENSSERKDMMTEQTVVRPQLNFVQIEMDVTIQARPERVFQAITHDIASWWDETCTYKRGKMILEPEVGKRFYEDCGNGTGSLFGVVTLIEQNRLLEIEGHMGMEQPVQGIVRYELVPQGEATLLKFSHRAFGNMREGTRENFTQGWTDMIKRRLPEFIAQNK
jgi:DNA-binding transcriptional ArsR family regulator/uncharacterized protein YndB with AHSA1/START domain